MFIGLETPPFEAANRLLGFRLRDKTLTMRELVHSLIKVNDGAFAAERESDQEIWDRLVRVIVRQLNCREDEVMLGATFARDLGVD